MRTAVEAVFVGRARAYNRRFLQLCSHHLVEPVACTPASGWEKGQVENQIVTMRDVLFRPKPKVKVDLPRICGRAFSSLRPASQTEAG